MAIMQQQQQRRRCTGPDQNDTWHDSIGSNKYNNSHSHIAATTAATCERTECILDLVELCRSTHLRQRDGIVHQILRHRMDISDHSNGATTCQTRQPVFTHKHSSSSSSSSHRDNHHCSMCTTSRCAHHSFIEARVFLVY